MSAQMEEKKELMTRFDGKTKNFDIWHEKFIARSFEKKFHSILVGKVKVPEYGVDYNDDDKKMKPDEIMQQLIDMNIKGYNDLIQCIDASKDAGRTEFCLVLKRRDK
jgi:hypothetical protein